MDKKEAIRLYCGLMEEVKVRFDIINRICLNQDGYPPAIVREICYLQFRFICELIALACLVAHGDIPEVQSLRDTYEPGKILKLLERLNPYFYPQPMQMVRDEEKKQAVLRALPEKIHLQQQELPKLWGMAGDVLHRSPLVKLLAQNDHADDDFSDIFEWGAKLAGLLESHWITLEENKKGMYVSLRAQETGAVAVSIYDFDAAPGEVNVSTTWVK